MDSQAVPVSQENISKETLDAMEARIVARIEAKKKRGPGKDYKHKRPKPEPVSMEELYNLGMSADVPTRLLFFMLYLTGGRISEVMQIRRRDITEEVIEGVSVVRVGMPTSMGTPVVMVKLVTRKNRREPQREIPIIKNSRNADGKMLDEVLRLIENADFAPDAFLFAASKKTYERMIKRLTANLDAFEWNEYGTRERVSFENFPLFCHYLRHCRATDLVKVYDYNPFELAKYMGWSDPRMAGTYIHLNMKDAVRKMV